MIGVRSLTTPTSAFKKWTKEYRTLHPQVILKDSEEIEEEFQ
jgi:hypothetical protein